MRKLKLQVQMTIDGYIAGPNGELDFMVWNWDDELKRYVDTITEPVDCIVLGRKLAEGFIPYWATVAANPNDPEFAAGKKFTAAADRAPQKTPHPHTAPGSRLHSRRVRHPARAAYRWRW